MEETKMAEEIQPKTRSFTAYIENKTNAISLFRFAEGESKPANGVVLSAEATADVLVMRDALGTTSDKGEGKNVRIFAYTKDIDTLASGAQILKTVYPSNRQFARKA